MGQDGSLARSICRSSHCVPSALRRCHRASSSLTDRGFASLRCSGGKVGRPRRLACSSISGGLNERGDQLARLAELRSHISLALVAGILGAEVASFLLGGGFVGAEIGAIGGDGVGGHVVLLRCAAMELSVIPLNRRCKDFSVTRKNKVPHDHT